KADDEHAVAIRDGGGRPRGGAVGRAQPDHRRTLCGGGRGHLLPPHRDPFPRHQTALISSGATRTITRLPSATRVWTLRATSAPVPGGRGLSGAHGMAAPGDRNSARPRSTMPRKSGSSSCVTTTHATRGSACRFRTLALLRYVVR